MAACQNVASFLTENARRFPEQTAVVTAMSGKARRAEAYHCGNLKQLDGDSSRIASGLAALGIPRGTRLALFVRPGWDFVSLVFALLKGGYVAVLVDPGLGWRRVVNCLAELRPEGFIGIPLAHLARLLVRHRLGSMKYLVTVGRRWAWGGRSLRQVRAAGEEDFAPVPVSARDPAAVIFTSGSTGPPKGVLYDHGHFAAQIQSLRDCFGIQSGEVDLATFPLFGLFDAAMAVTTVFPRMDFTRPARVHPPHLLRACRDWHVTQAFGSPALWNTVARYCERTGERLQGVRRVFSAGAPVSADLLARLKNVVDPQARIYTPYGATEALPLACIEAGEILTETAARTRQGAGVCVGRMLPGIRARVVAISDEPIRTIDAAQDVPVGKIGELVVSGAVVTEQYVTCPTANASHKILDHGTIWHRMGDVGYFDDQQRFWFCGRKSQRVQTEQGVMYTVPCEAILNQHPDIYRSALVGVGKPPRQIPVIVAEPWPDRWPSTRAARDRLLSELRQLAATHPLTRSIQHFFLMRSLPVDIRHNAKIFYERLADWAARRLPQGIASL